MRNLGYLLLFIVLGIILHQFLDWYAIAIAGLLFGLLAPVQSVGQAFAYGLLAGVLVWGGYSGLLNWQNEGLLASRLGVAIGGLSQWGLVAVTAVLGGIYAALGAITGYLGRQLVSPQAA